MVLISAETPEQVLKVMDIFRKLLSDDDNFIDPSEWGKTEDGKEVMPFSFSDKGLARVEGFRSYKPFEHVYRSGTAGIKKEHYSLLYFLTQFLVTLAFFADSIDLMGLSKSNEEEREALESLKNKFTQLKYRVNPRQIYHKIPVNKKFSQEEYEKAKSEILDVIKRVEDDYESVKDLTKHEEDFVLSH